MNIKQLLLRICLGEDSTLQLNQLRISDHGKWIETHADGWSDELAVLGNAHPGYYPGKTPGFAGGLFLSRKPK